jgi:Peptidase A4 family
MITVSALTGLALLTWAGAASARTTAGPRCDSSFNPYRYTEAQVAACGYTVEPEISQKALPGGGTAISYRMPHGKIARNIVPPAGFRPETATAAQLKEYGFPPRPADRAQLARWNFHMARWKGAVKPTSFLAITHSRADTETSGNWAGYVAQDYSGIQSDELFTEAGGSWNEVSIYSSRCSTTSEVTWVGLGGWASGDLPLAQAGTGYGVPGMGSHQVWWELYPNNNITPINFNTSPGSDISVSAAYINSGYNFLFRISPRARPPTSTKASPPCPAGRAR